VVTSANVKVGLESQASVAVGVTNDGVAGHSMAVLPGRAEITGAVLSSTLMVWLAVLLPQALVAVQVRVVEYSCGHAPGVVTSTKVNRGLRLQASVAVGVVNTGVAGHWIVDFPGRAEITGMHLVPADRTQAPCPT
jgi:hypothetical protein